MATTLAQQSAIAADSALRSRIASAVSRVAASVRAEPANQPYPAASPLGTSMNATRSSQRQTLVLAASGGGLVALVEPMARQIANNTTIQGECTYAADGSAITSAVLDSDIVYVVATSWDLVAGVLPSNIP